MAGEFVNRFAIVTDKLMSNLNELTSPSSCGGGISVQCTPISQDRVILSSRRRNFNVLSSCETQEPTLSSVSPALGNRSPISSDSLFDLVRNFNNEGWDPEALVAPARERQTHGRTNFTESEKNLNLLKAEGILESYKFLCLKSPRDGKFHNCKKNCNEQRRLDTNWLEDVRADYANNHSGEKVQYLYTLLRDGDNSAAPLHGDLSCTVRGVRMCDRCFRVMFNVAKNTWTKLKKAVLDGRRPEETRPLRRDLNMPTLREKIDAFISVQVSNLAEAQPRKNELHMDKVKPSFLIRRFKNWCKLHRSANLFKVVNGQDRYNFDDSYFRKRWAYRLKYGQPKLCLRLYKGVSSSCFTCSRCDRRRANGKTPSEREFWREQKEKHLDFVFMERVLLNERELLAELDNRVLHLIMDGWDSMKTVVPNFGDFQGELKGLYKNFLKMKLSGVKVTAWKLFLGRTFPWVITGGNLACTTLIHVLSIYVQQNKALPSHAEFLVDGGSENVNVTFLSLCSWLVTKRVFQSISVRRLPVGHTHNGLDQSYSAPSDWFHGNDAHEAITPEDWLQQVRITPLRTFFYLM